jgi:hypothetical protein
LTASSAFLSKASFDREGGSFALDNERMGWVLVFFEGFSDVVVVGCSERRDVRVSPNLVAVVGLLRSGCQLCLD